jgi:anti-sigma B factor antagonist
VATNRLSLLRGAGLSASDWQERSAHFRILAQMDRDVVRICPLGDVDIETVGPIRERIKELAAAGEKRVVLDLRGATFLDSAGLHLVLDADSAARAEGWEFGLIGGPARVQRVFDLTGSRARLPFLTASELSALLTAEGDSTA